MKKIIIGFVFILLATVLITGCATQSQSKETPKEPRQITITIGDKEIDYVVGKNIWNGAIDDREDIFQTILKKDSKIDIQYIEIGEIVEVIFENNPPSKLTIYDIIIDENGRQLYTNKHSINFSVELKKGKGIFKVKRNLASFEIKKNLASYLSSTYKENKRDIRGIRMVASWGENECEYAFIIKTDAL